MSSRGKKLLKAWLDTPSSGKIELSHDWRARYNPPLVLIGKEPLRWSQLTRVPDYLFGCDSAYFVNRHDEIFFFLRLNEHPELATAGAPAVYLAGDFNGWAEAIGDPVWVLQRSDLDGEPVLIWRGEASPFFSHPWQRFKFVTGEGHWLHVPAHAPNSMGDETGNVNRVIDPDRTGQHLFQFTLDQPLDLAETWKVGWSDGADGQQVPLMPGAYFFNLSSDLPLGVSVQGQRTSFRLFAPRARAVHLCVCQTLEAQTHPLRYELARHDDVVWELELDQNLHGWFYWYHIEGPQDVFGLFMPEHRVLDPYALATVGREGPGIIVSQDWVGAADLRGFVTPAWHDLVIAEAHVRDLTQLAPLSLKPEERRGFAGLAEWVRSPDFYLHHLGVNCVELQPVQEADAKTVDEYHWGYMTVNFFAPASGYSSSPESASGIRELQEVVAAFHDRGIAVILDVVFNHVGEPGHLMFIDKLYYFEQDSAGQLANWSGCGNDIRANAAMVRRLVADSCRHFIKVFGVDGFRFDLAELLGVDLLRGLEAELKAIKPDVILIAEPWSFRGHIAAQLRDTGWASWNDGYRNFVRDFVRGGSSRGSYEYFLKGSPWHFAKWPAQTVNYAESHDDRSWIDLITENAGFDGYQPTANDRRRTHLMVAILMMSIGIPMLSAGQDFLRSKRGVNNTYLRGDLNALDYTRPFRFPATHAYFAAWVGFRRSALGRLLRQYSRMSEGFFRFWFAPDSLAAATLYNADRSQGAIRLLFVVNPTLADATVVLEDLMFKKADVWRLIADTERFIDEPVHGMTQTLNAELFTPALSCALWVCET